MARPPPSSPRRSLAQWLIRTEPLALILLLILAVLLLVVTLAVGGHHAPPPATAG